LQTLPVRECQENSRSIVERPKLEISPYILNRSEVCASLVGSLSQREQSEVQQTATTSGIVEQWRSSLHLQL